MLIAGKKQILHLSRFTPQGAYLVCDESLVGVERDEEQEIEEVLLPNRYITDAMVAGSELEVFVYHDSEDRIVATTDTPYIKVGEAALLEVIDKGNYGAFLDWGLPKDLFLPFSNQTYRPNIGEWVVVYAYIDEVTGRIVSTMHLNKYIRNENIEGIEVGDEVTALPATTTELGYRCVINNKYWGIMYHNQIFRNIRQGDILKCYITKITEDDRIDISLQPTGRKQLDEASRILLRLLEDEEGGILCLGDKSSPDDIYKTTQMSKKMFKRGVGSLLREGRITIEATRITLVK